MLKEIAKSVLPGSLQGMLRTIQAKRAVDGYKARVARRTYAGHTIDIVLEDPVAEQWYDNDWDQLPEIEIMLGRSILPGAIVFDLGAHQGVVAMMMAEQVGPAGRVVAVEANEHNVRIARKNAILNTYSNIEVLFEAVAARPGTLRFNTALNGQADKGTGSHGVVEVRATTIDEMVSRFGRPNAIFVDVEGFECEVLKAATAVMDGKTDFFVEVHGGAGLEDFGGSIDQVLSFFPASHFDLFHQPEVCTPFVPFDATIDRSGLRWCLVALGKASTPRTPAGA